MRPPVRLILWLIPLVLHAESAQAWGLYTHVYFAQHLVWLVPLLCPVLQRLLRRHPDLVMAGSCLPDLALTGPHLQTDAFDHTHEWHTARRLLEQASSDEQRAIAVGFASHLLVDIIAHNHFVPAHQRLWPDWGIGTHILSEWAMDRHIAPPGDPRPSPTAAPPRTCPGQLHRTTV